MYVLAHRSINAIAIGLVAFAYPDFRVSAQQISQSVFSVRLESTEAVYRADEPIRLRTTLINGTARFYAVFWAPPFWITDLHIVGEDGRRIATDPKLPVWGYVTSLHHLIEFSPDQAIVQTHSDADGANRVEWIDLRFWGYVLKPGKYTITAVATMRGFERARNGEIVKSTDETFFTAASNTLRIEVLP